MQNSKVLFSFAVLAAIITLGSSCLDCDCLQTQPTKPSILRPLNLGLSLPSLRDYFEFIRNEKQKYLNTLFTTKRKIANQAIDLREDLANNTLQVAAQAEQALINAIPDKPQNPLIPNPLVYEKPTCQTCGSDCGCNCNCIPKSQPKKPACKKPLPKIYLPRPTINYVINTTALSNMYKKQKPKKQLVSCVKTVKTYVEQEDDEEECEYDTENIQYEIEDQQQQVTVETNTNVVNNGKYIYDGPDPTPTPEDDDPEDNEDLLDEEVDPEEPEEESDDEPATPPSPSAKPKRVKWYNDDDDDCIEIRVVKPKGTGCKYCKTAGSNRYCKNCSPNRRVVHTK